MDEGQNNGALTGAQEGAQNPAAQGGQGTPAGAGATGQGQTGPAGSGQVNNPAVSSVEYQPFSTGDGGEPIDAETHSKVVSLAREFGMTQEQAQKWVNLGISKFTDGQEAIRLEIAKKFTDWENQSKNDEEIKPFLDGNGKLPKVGEFANRVMGEDAKQFLNMAAETGVGANPLFIKFCLRAMKLVGEAPFYSGNRGANPAKSLEEQAKSLFPDM